MSTTTRLLVRKDLLASAEWATEPDVPLQAGEVRVRVDRFALTANNITYAAFGDAMNYWAFFPAAPQHVGMGIIPVWGFGSVVESSCPGVEVGERLYGYYPMATSVVLAPARVTPAGFVDAAAHRQALHAVYNQYMRCAADPFYTAETEDLQALLRPLFVTSWLIDDFLADNAFFGAAATPGKRAVLLLSSASSKTAWGTAFVLAVRSRAAQGTGEGIEVVGLTSAANVAYCESLGCYDRVLTYDQLGQVDASAPCVYVDFAGNAILRHAIHTRFVNLAYSCSIGGTHVEKLGGARDLPGPKATLFFAPAQIKKRHADWGAQAFGQRLVEGWQALLARVSDPAEPWLRVHHHRGQQAALAAYQAVLGGKGNPREGHILSIAD